MASVGLGIEIFDGVGLLSWQWPVDTLALAEALAERASQLLARADVHRLEAQVPVNQSGAARSVHRAGFRLEGRRRQAYHDGQQWVDVLCYSRLAEDLVDGPEGFSAIMNTVLARKRVMAHALFRNPAGELLFCDTHFKADWELPGGIVEPLEAPRLGAQREVTEELGLTVEFGPLLVVDWLPPWLGWEDALAFVFDGGTLTEGQIAAIVPQPSEIAAVHFATFDYAQDQLTDRARLRYRAALDQLECPKPSTVLLEAGRRVR